MELKLALELERDRLLSQIRMDRRMIRGLPDRRLEMHTVRGKRYLSKEVKDGDGNRFRAVKENEFEMVKRIRKCHFLKERIRRNEKAVKLLQPFLKEYEPCDDASIWKKVPKTYRLALTCQEFKGIQDDQGEIFLEDNLIHTNSRGEVFRSKAEMQISEILQKRKLNYVYEPVLYLGDHKVRPDFKVIHPKTGEAIYIEYFGMIGNDDYTKKTMEKIYWYLESGYIPNETVIFLMETANSGLHLRALNKTLDAVLN
ncbi:MAG: hypothetical protein IKT25_00535 [Firmicutes bacterium]|nr:hypothetical protein [Bacillota bacterium]